MKDFASLPKLKRGDKVAVLSPSFAAPGKWPHVHELGLARLRDEFGLTPVEFPTTRMLGASAEARAKDLADAFADPEIRGVIASLGGDDQITYAKRLAPEPFIANPKPYFGYSDSTHLEHFLWMHGIPSFYGGHLFTQFAMQGRMDEYTKELLSFAMFEGGERELRPAERFNDIGLDWGDPSSLGKERAYEPSEGWFFEGAESAEGVTWGGCLESIDEMLRHGIELPSLEDFERVILFTETSEELPSTDYVMRVFRALGERGILGRVRGLLVGRPKAWEFHSPRSPEERERYRAEQRAATLSVFRRYNASAPIVQGIDFGHTDPQIPLPNGRPARIDVPARKLWASF